MSARSKVFGHSQILLGRPRPDPITDNLKCRHEKIFTDQLKRTKDTILQRQIVVSRGEIVV